MKEETLTTLKNIKRYEGMGAKAILDHYDDLTHTSKSLKHLIKEGLITGGGTNWIESLKQRDRYLGEVRNEIIKRMQGKDKIGDRKAE